MTTFYLWGSTEDIRSNKTWSIPQKGYYQFSGRMVENSLKWKGKIIFSDPDSNIFQVGWLSSGGLEDDPHFTSSPRWGIGKILMKKVPSLSDTWFLLQPFYPEAVDSLLMKWTGMCPNKTLLVDLKFEFHMFSISWNIILLIFLII